MNLHQFRVLSALLALPSEFTFTTADLVRESGVSAEVVRKTYQRHAKFFTVVHGENTERSGGRWKVRKLTPTAREEIRRELYEASGRPPGPPIPRGPEGEPVGLLAAEQVLYDLVPVATGEQRAQLLSEARLHLDSAERDRDRGDEREFASLLPRLRAEIKSRLEMLHAVLEIYAHSSESSK